MAPSAGADANHDSRGRDDVVDDVVGPGRVGAHATGDEVEVEVVARAPGDVVVGAGGIAADADTADDLVLCVIEAEATAEAEGRALAAGAPEAAAPAAGEAEAAGFTAMPGCTGAAGAEPGMRTLGSNASTGDVGCWKLRPSTILMSARSAGVGVSRMTLALNRLAR